MNIDCYLSRFSHHFYAAACVQIHEAALNGNLQKIEELLKGNPNLASSKDNSGFTPLHLAALMGHKDVAALLLANKVEVNAKDNSGSTALHKAASSGKKNVLELLLANKAEIDAKNNNGQTPLHVAVVKGYKDVVELLQANNAEINAEDKFTIELRKAAKLLSVLPMPLGADVVMCMANAEQTSPDLINKFTTIMEQKLRSLVDFSRESNSGIRAVAELIKWMDTNAAAAILEKIDGENHLLALSIRDLMFVFDDVMLIDDAGMRQLLARLDKKWLTIAMKGTSEELRNQFFRNMSKVAVEMMKEDMHVLGPVRVEDVEIAQQQILCVIRKLVESGVISRKRGGCDEYVN
jgi:flagellar motor switch protein FliG